MILKCAKCGQSFSTEDKRRKYCSVQCYGLVRKERKGGSGAFKKGFTPWNKGKRGVRVSPGSEFKPGNKPHNYIPVGTETIRIDKSGKPRVWVKVSDGQQMRPRAQVVWEKHNGPIPSGYIVHHKNRNTTDDDIENLELETRRDHLKEHRQEMPRPILPRGDQHWRRRQKHAEGA